MRRRRSATLVTRDFVWKASRWPDTLGHAKESQRALGELITKHAQHSACQIAHLYAWRHQKYKAFEWLERPYQQHDGGLSEFKNDLLLQSLRGDARFAAMLRKTHLSE